MSPARHIATTLAWAMLLTLIPLGPVLGSASSILASGFAILLLPFALLRGGWREIVVSQAMRLFLSVFLALAICFALTAREPRDALFAFNFLSLPLTAAVYALSRRSQASAIDVVTTFAALCLGGVLTGLLVALNDIFLRGLAQVYGFNMGPHVVARICLLLGFLALAAMFAVRSPWRYLLYLGPLGAFVIVLLSGTRGALIAIPALAVIYIAALGLARREWRHALLVAAALVAGLGLLLLSGRMASVFDVAAQLIGSGATSEGAANERLAMLGAAWQLFWQSPIVGHGWAHFAALAHPLIGAVVWGGPDDPFFQFHNDTANFAVAAGASGLLCWLALLAAPLVGALATPRDSLFAARLYCCLILSASTFVFGLTDMTLGYDLPTTLYAFLTAIVLGGTREQVPRPRGSTSSP